MAAEQQEHVMSPRHLGSPLRIFTTEGKKKRKAIGRFIHKFTKSSSSKYENGGAFNSPDSSAAEEYSKWNQNQNQNFVDVNDHYDQDEDTLMSLIQKDSKDGDEKMEKLHNPNQPSDHEKEKKNTPVLTEETDGANNNYKEEVYHGVAPKESDRGSTSPPKAEYHQKPSKPTHPDEYVNWNDQQPLDKNNVNNNHLTNNEEQLKHEEIGKYATDEYGGEKEMEEGKLGGAGGGKETEEEKLAGAGGGKETEEEKHAGVGGGKETEEEKLAGAGGGRETEEEKLAGAGGRKEMEEEKLAGAGGGKEMEEEKLAGTGGGKEMEEEKLAGTGGGKEMEEPATGLRPHQEDSCVTSLAKGLQRMCGGGNK